MIAKPKPAVRIDKAVLFAQMKYAPHAGQRRVHKSKARFRVLACGTRWGKSTCAAMEAVCELFEPRESSIGWSVAPSYALSKIVFDRVRMAVLEYFPHRVLEDDQRSQRFIVQNIGGGRSELRSKSSENPTSLLGEGLDYVIVDEAATMREEVWTSYISPRLVDRNGRALLISTPRGIDWFYEQFERGQGDDPEFESWRGSTLDNPLISADVIESERRRLTRDVFQQEYEARFLGEDDEPCKACGNPSDSLRRDLVFADYATEPRCTICSGIVDLKGRTREHRRPPGGRTLIIDLGPGMPGSLEHGQDLATEIVRLRQQLDQARPFTN